MADEQKTMPGDVPGWVKEAQEQMKSGEPFPQGEATPEVTIKFGRGLVGDPFTSKSGKELVEVKIPNQDPADKTPWASFVISNEIEIQRGMTTSSTAIFIPFTTQELFQSGGASLYYRRRLAVDCTTSW